MIVAFIYTKTNPKLIQLIENEVFEAAPNEDVQVLIYSDPTVLSDVIDHGEVTTNAAKRAMKMYFDAVTSGADIVYSICSSIGDVADAAQSAFKIMGIPLIRIDENMAVQAIRKGKRIGVLATLSTTLNPTKRLIQRCAQEMGSEVELVDSVSDGLFGKSQAELEKTLVKAACEISDQVDVILLAQASMTLCAEAITLATGKEVFSSPKYGAMAVAEAISSHKAI